jgi:hypothetical protein
VSLGLLYTTLPRYRRGWDYCTIQSFCEAGAAIDISTVLRYEAGTTVHTSALPCGKVRTVVHSFSKV